MVDLNKRSETTADAPHFTLLEFLTRAFKDRHWLALGFLIPAVATVFVASSIIPSYEAKSTLMVRVGREHIYQPEVGELNAQPIPIGRLETLRSELNILTSRDLQERVVGEIGATVLFPALGRRPLKPGQKLEEQALLEMESRLDAVLLKDSNVIEVAFRHFNPRLAAEVVNRLVSAYVQKRQDVLSERRASFMGGEVVSTRERLTTLDSRIDTFKREHGIVSYDRQRELLLDQRTAIEAKLRDATARLAEVQGRLQVMRPTGSPGDGGISPAVTAQANESFRLGAVRDLVATEALRLQAEERSAEAAKSILLQQLGDIRLRLKDFATRESELQQMVRERQVIENSYQASSRRLEDARILEDLDKLAKSSVSVIQPATPPLKRKGTRMLILGIGGAVSLLSTLLVAFVCDLLRSGFLLPDQLRRSVGLPVLACFPKAKRS
jgi:polysaccharide biosynthesis protein PslE